MSWSGPTVEQQQAQGDIAARLATIGFVLPGSIAVRSYRCGKHPCRCHANPPVLHGPYHQWTRQANGRTIHTNLTPEQHDDYQPYFDEAKRLRTLVYELEHLTLTVVQQDPRTKR